MIDLLTFSKIKLDFKVLDFQAKKKIIKAYIFTIKIGPMISKISSDVNDRIIRRHLSSASFS